jgi:AcrR family transcriptional regulator
MPNRKRLSASARRAQLIDVGRRVFAQRGFEAVSVEELAERAKVSKPILYQHFGGKEGLYAVVVDREMDRLIGLISDAIATGAPSERLEQAAAAFLRYVRDEPEGFAVLCHDAPAGANEGSLSSVLNDVAGRVGTIFAREFKKAGYNPRHAPIYAHALIGMVTFVGQWWVTVRKPPLEVVARHIAALAWMGLRHLPRQPRPIGRRPALPPSPRAGRGGGRSSRAARA